MSRVARLAGGLKSNSAKQIDSYRDTAAAVDTMSKHGFGRGQKDASRSGYLQKKGPLGVWQKRWFVLGSGKLELFYSPESTSDDDRIYSMPLSVVRIVAQPKTVRPEAPYAFRITIKDVKQ